MQTLPDIEIVRRMYDAYNRRDLDGWLEPFASTAEWTNVPTGEVHVGPNGQRTNYAAWNVPFPTGQCVDLTIKGCSDVVVVEFVGKGRNTGPLPTVDGGQVPPTNRFVAVTFCDVHELQDGQIVRTRRYWDQATVAAQLDL